MDKILKICRFQLPGIGSIWTRVTKLSPPFAQTHLQTEIMDHRAPGEQWNLSIQSLVSPKFAYLPPHNDFL